MLEAYSINATVGSMEPIPFNNVTLKKGCTAELTGTSTIQLNKCGVYMISFDATSAAVASAQLYKNGIAQPQAQGSDTSLAFTTLVQVTENNCPCPCTAPTTVQILNTDDAEATFTNANIVITKVV